MNVKWVKHNCSYGNYLKYHMPLNDEKFFNLMHIESKLYFVIHLIEDRKLDERLSGSEFTLETLIFLEILEAPCFSEAEVQQRVSLKACL